MVRILLVDVEPVSFKKNNFLNSGLNINIT